jgi:hypothetical protein
MAKHESEQQLRLKNEALVRSHEEMDRLIYNTSHDLRAPLRATLGLLDLQEDPETTAEERGENHRLMRASLERCDRIIRDILEFSRSSRCSPRPERVNIEALVQDCLENLRPTPEASQVHFEVDVPLDLSLSVDQPCLRSILQSLLTNAVQFQRGDEARPWVSIRASEVQGQMVLQVEDNGEGIPASLQQEVFRMFYRGSHRSQGAGLGLYFARQMAQRLGGQVNLESSPGVGSTFTLRLPLAPEAE